MKIEFIVLAAIICLAGCGNKEEKAAEFQPQKVSTDVNTVQGIAIIEPAGRIVSIAAETAGVVKETRVETGQKILKGQVLLVLASETEESQLRQARSKTITQTKSVEAVKSDIGTLEVQLNQARANYERNKRLYAGNAITKKELDDSYVEVEDLRKKIEAIDAKVSEQKARINELTNEEKYYKTLLENKVVTAPSNGTLLSLDVKAGEYIDGSSPVAEFAPEGPIVAITEIDELFAHKVQIGQSAEIRLQGGGELLSTGKVILTSPYLRKKSLFSDSPDDLEDRRVREVRVQLDNPGKVLLGAKVECIIKVK